MSIGFLTAQQMVNTVKNILLFAIVVLSSATFAQAVKPCKCPDAGSGGSCVDAGSGGSCVDAGVLGIDLYDSAYISRNWGSTDFRPCFETGIAATYVFKNKMAATDLDAVRNFGGTWLTYNVGGWNLYTDSSDVLSFRNWSPSSGSPVVMDVNAYDAGVHTVCVHKSAADVYKLTIDGVQLATDTSSQSSCNPEWRTKFVDDPRPYKGIIYQAAFFYGAELSAAQCGSIADGGLSVASFAADAGMEFGYIFNRNGADLSPVDPDYVQLYGKMKFSP